MNDARKPKPGASDRAQPGWGIGDPLQASFDMSSAWLRSWSAIVAARGAPTAEMAFAAMANPMGWPDSVAPLLDEVARALALPRFADLPRVGPAALPAPGASIELALLFQQYLSALVPVWMKACDNFQTELRERREKGQTLDLAGEGLDVWNAVLDRTLMEFNRSNDFGALQKKMLRLSMAQRKTMRRQVEIASEALDMPTRAEMLDVYERLHGLMREVHGLRREVRALKAARSEAPARIESEQTERPRARSAGRR